MKRIFSLLCAVALISAFTLSGCGDKSGGGGGKISGDSACLITSTPQASEFISDIWTGFEELEKDGWTVKCFEALEEPEQADQIRAACSEGYGLIYIQGEDVRNSVQGLSGELVEKYPDTRFFFLDTDVPAGISGGTSLTIDPFESCFIAGYVAARWSNTKQVGLIMPVEDDPALERFAAGYQAGIDYVNNGAQIIKAYTGDRKDESKGYEALMNLVEGSNIDVVIQCASLSGYGVISACSELGLRCVGVNSWQGGIDPVVFWSAVRPMGDVVVRTAELIKDGQTLPSLLVYTIRDDLAGYDDRDLENLPDDVRQEVVLIKDEIISGRLDVYSGIYEEYRPTER